MFKRVSTSIFIVVITALFMLLRFVDIRLFDIYPIIMALLGTHEVVRALKGEVSLGQRFAIYGFVILVFPIAIFFKEELFKFIILYSFIAIIYTVIENRGDSLKPLGYLALCMFYPTIPLLGFVFINDFSHSSFYVLLVVFTTSWFSDVGGYLIGSTFKGPKLCPELSPNKTISGAIGGIIGGVLATFTSYFCNIPFGLSIFNGAELFFVILFLISSGMFLSSITQLGDIFESYLKRKLHIKDMGNILPGHGGVLDRIDGLVINSFVTYILYSFLI